MIASLAALSFAAPWALGALAVLPVIWWLLKVNPPAPRLIRFPAARLLLGLRHRDETPIKTPLWLVILRLLIATLAILAVAGPLINPPVRLRGQGPLLVVIDDGWAAAPHWERRVDTLEALIDQAERAHRDLVVATTAPQLGAGVAKAAPAISGLLTPAEARKRVQALGPKPWAVDRAGLLAAMATPAFRDAVGENADIAWLSDGLVAADPVTPRKLAARLQRLGAVRVYAEPAAARAVALLPPRETASDLRLRVLRAVTGPAPPLAVRASAADGRLIARQTVVFDEGEAIAEQPLVLPTDLRNDIARLEIEGVASAGAVVLLDARWRRRPVGLVSGGSFERSQPLLSDLYYLERALRPYNEVRRGTVAELLASGLSVLVLADVGRIPDDERRALEQWMEQGGVLIRFAGPRLAAADDSLVPVRLRSSGGRALGGALSWQQPMPLSAFPERSPFAELTPPGDVVVKRQVLAEPGPDLARRTWARLGDGTPLVTGAPRGDGWLVLFHTTANTDWSNLALSGLFVEMMRRLVELSEGVGEEAADGLLPPLETLDGFGRLAAPPPNALPIAARSFAAAEATPRHPPGLYGNSLFRRALNLGARLDRLSPITDLPRGVERAAYGARREIDLRPWLLVAVLALALIDTLIGLALRGLLPRGRRRAAGRASIIVLAALAGAAIGAPASPASAQAEAKPAAGGETTTHASISDAMVIESTRQTRLAYVLTGDEEVDAISRAGLIGLSWILRLRTAIEPAAPVAVDPAIDELVFYPLLYWPLTEAQAPLSGAALANVNAYLRVGGLILLDTRDQAPGAEAGAASGRNGERLRHLLGGLDLPPLVVVPPGHALTQAFYLMNRFPGRWASGDVWVERYEGGVNDGVSSLVIGGNDWASAWALSPTGMPLFPVVPGGERQREMAFRFGINLTMYALTGNYKADQVHIPAILRRLRQTGLEPTE